MFTIVRFTGCACTALALVMALPSCDKSANDALTAGFAGNAAAEHQQLQAQLQQVKNELADLDQKIAQAESRHSRLTYDLQKRLENQGSLRTPFSARDIDHLPDKRRDFEHLCFDIEDMRNVLAQRKQELHAMQYQYEAYAAKLADFKQAHPVD